MGVEAQLNYGAAELMWPVSVYKIMIRVSQLEG